MENLEGTTGVYIKAPTKTYKDFLIKVQESKIVDRKKGRRELVICKLLDAYNKHGDNLFNISESTPF